MKNLNENLKRKRGRPKKKTAEAMGTFFAARFNQAETKLLNEKIKKSNMTKTEWIRDRLLGE